MMKVLLLVALFVVARAASLERTSKDPNGGEWVSVGKPSAQEKLKVTFAIIQSNPEWLKEKLRAVSYPSSPEYGNYMNFDEIAKYVHGKPESVKTLVDSLAHVGVAARDIDFTLGKDFAVVELTVEAAEELFSTEFFTFQHREVAGWTTVKALDYEIPSQLKPHLDFVAGISKFPTVNNKKHFTRSPNLGINPGSIADSYKTDKYVSTSSMNSQAIAGFLGQFFDASDLKKFQSDYNLPVRAITKIVGKDIPSDPGTEANLDVEYISATGRNVSTWFISISTRSNGNQEDFLSWVVGQVNTTDSPWVHSASYGDKESSIDNDYIHRVDNEFMKFGVSGRSVLFASGDSGVDCSLTRKFHPEWPTSSPYITSVGGTTSLTRVWSSGGGGFSNVFGTPDYQKDIVTAYLNSGKAPSTRDFNTSGRAYPDVSAFSVDFTIVEDGIPIGVSGTSCAAPTMAGVISILNDVRLLAGKKTLGFLNPLLYQTLKGNGFFDITEGSNGGELCSGFKAIEGWDPASGWGSPNFSMLKTLI